MDVECDGVELGFPTCTSVHMALSDHQWSGIDPRSGIYILLHLIFILFLIWNTLILHYIPSKPPSSASLSLSSAIDCDKSIT